MCIENLKKEPKHAKMLEDGTIKIITADGRKGYAAEGKPTPTVEMKAFL